MADSDGDGLPEHSKHLHPAHADAANDEINIDDANAYLDTDQDGLLNGQEVAEFNSDSFGDGAEYFIGTSLTQIAPNTFHCIK
jgi:Bacterial TSP3 repeat